METLSGVAQTASKIIFGEGATQQPVVGTESGTEPLSGEKGTGSVEDPYDAGNNEEKTETTASKVDNINGPPNESQSDHHPVQQTEDGDRKTDGPINVEEPSAEDGEKLMALRDPNDHSGEPMKMHSDESVDKPKGGDTENTENTEDSKDPADVADTPAEKEAVETKEKGTGEQWVKSSGMAADGGDFDASQAGAGREADRLLEEKGVHKSDSGAHQSESSGLDSSTDTATDSKEKVSKVQKIKHKLHIGSSKHA